LRVIATRNAGEVARFGWRPSQQDLALLRNSTQDAAAYRICARAWKRAGFKVFAIKRFAGRMPRPTNSRFRTLRAEAMDAAMHPEPKGNSNET
jgi:hypothetical protein